MGKIPSSLYDPSRLTGIQMGGLLNTNPNCAPIEVCINGCVNYLDTYSPVVNFMSVRSMLTLSILRELHTKLVYFVLAKNHAGVK